MAGTTYNITNNTQSSLQQVVSQALPVVDTTSTLVYTSGSSGLTTAGVPGTILPSLVLDQVLQPGNWHGGYKALDATAIKFYGEDITNFTNTPIDVISAYKQKGIFELRESSIYNITNVTSGTSTIITTSTAHLLKTNQYVLITGINTVIPDGMYKITSISGTTLLTIDFDSSATATYISGGDIKQYEYFWDEVYTTPIGLFQCVDTTATPGYAEFKVTNNDSNELKIRIEEVNEIIPKVNDTILLQRFFSDINSYSNQSGTDGINNVVNYSRTETYMATVTAVSSVAGAGYVTYTVTLDKSFKPVELVSGEFEKYMVVLLNREGIPTNRELKPDTWSLTEVQRQQLLGDPYDYVGVSLPAGRKDYLYYGGSDKLGYANLLRGIIDSNLTPFSVFTFGDAPKDRINSTIGEIEIHLPTVLIQGERNSIILTNASASLYDNGGAGEYAALTLKYGNDTTKRYGWIFFDLRIVVIDDAEFATALGYTSNRNYTLPEPVTPIAGNTLQFATINNPLLIDNITKGLTTTISLAQPHNLVTGDLVHLFDIVGISAINSPIDQYYTITVLDDVTFTIAVDTTANTETYQGGGKVSTAKLPYEYFYTYRLIGGHYDTTPYSKVIPFNFQSNGKINNTATGTIDIQVPQLTHLVELSGTERLNEGFEADQFEIIIGKYIQDVNDVSLISGIEDVVVMVTTTQNDLLSGGVQVNPHATSYTFTEYTDHVTNIDVASLPFLKPTGYNLIDSAKTPIYNITPLNNSVLIGLVGRNSWLPGFVKYKEVAKQFRLTFEVTVAADKWNGTTNPTFENGNPLMKEKLISEIAFLIKDLNVTTNEKVNPAPYVYAKINPVIKKTNVSDIVIQISIDF